MSVYKEGYYIIDQIQKRSKQIYSCEYGALIQVGDQLWLMVKSLIEWYGLPETRTRVNYGTNNEHHTLEVVVELMDEGDTGRIEPFKITYTTIKDKVNGVYYDGYFEVEKKPTREPERMKCTCKIGSPYNNLTCEIHGVDEMKKSTYKR